MSKVLTPTFSCAKVYLRGHLRIASRPIATTRYKNEQVNHDTVPISTGEVILTDAFVKQMKKVMKDGERLRIMVEGGGCSGFQYKFDIETNASEDDSIFTRNGASIVVDKESLNFIKGSKIDYREELIKSAFVVVDNPLAEEGCSCGASFNVKL